MMIARFLMADESDKVALQGAYSGIPAGVAVVDTGCTASLIGEDQLEEWRRALDLSSVHKLRPTEFVDKTTFIGIGGRAKSSQRVAWPVQLGPYVGQLRTSVVSGNAPCLLSSNALATLGASVSLGNKPSVTFGKLNKLTVPLQRSECGHLLLPLFLFNNNASTDHTTATLQDSLDGPSAFPTLPGPSPFNASPPNNSAASNQAVEQGSVTQQPDHCTEHAAEIATLRRLARITRGPWARNESFGEVQQLLVTLFGAEFQSCNQLISVQLAYRPQVYRNLPKDCETK